MWSRGHVQFMKHCEQISPGVFNEVISLQYLSLEFFLYPQKRPQGWVSVSTEGVVGVIQTGSIHEK